CRSRFPSPLCRALLPAFDLTIEGRGPGCARRLSPVRTLGHRMNSIQWKSALVAGALLVSVYLLWPTFQFYQLPAAQRIAAVHDTPAAKLREKAIPLGLDLQGGMHLVLEVDS